MGGLTILALLILFVAFHRAFEVTFVLLCRMLPKRQRVMFYNWLCANVFIDEGEGLCE